jgi:hypothetical protein
MKMNYSIGNNKGVTMTELIVAAVLLAVGIFGSLKVFRGISQSIFMSQTKQVATTLAREKLEALQVLPYYRLRAQGAPTYYQPGGSGKPYIYYDPYYTPGPETVQVGTVKYYRGAYVDRVYRDPSSGDLVGVVVNVRFPASARLVVGGGGAGLLPILREKLDAEIRRHPFEAPIERVMLEVAESVPGAGTQADFFSKKEEEREAWDGLLGSLASHLGKERVFMAQPTPRYLPARSPARRGDAGTPSRAGSVA